MSDHSLPSDMARWPRDPHQLLGVVWGVSARELRRAYLHLIRTYKPEHSPEQFQRIREAYETLLAYAPFSISPTADDDGPTTTPIMEHSGKTPSRAIDPRGASSGVNPRSEAISRDPWDLASEGKAREAYRILSDRLDSGRPREETYLQLYWLLVTHLDLDPDREPCDVLIRGLRTREGSAYLLRGLLEREAIADPQMAIGDRFQPLLDPHAMSESLPEIVGIRWKGARRLDRWEVINDDLNLLRPELSITDEETWARLLIVAASNLVWAEGGTGHVGFETVAGEIKAFGRNTLDLDEPLFRLDYAREIDKGLRRLAGGRNLFLRLLRLPVDMWKERNNIAPVFRRLFIFSWSKHDTLMLGFRRLLALSWDGPDHAADILIRSHLARVAKRPRAALRTIQLVAEMAPAVLARLAVVLDETEPVDLSKWDDPQTLTAILDFLESNRWWRYRKFRHHLLDFCLREMIPPHIVAQTAAGRPVFAIDTRRHLANLIVADKPLIYVYRACEICRS